MAAYWIKWTKGLTEKPEVIAIARALRKSEVEVAGRLMLVWEWADDNTEDGSIPHVDAKFIDKVAGLKGMASEMEKVGWLRIDAAGAIFPHFTRHNGDSAKRRALDAERKRLERASSTESGGRAAE